MAKLVTKDRLPKITFEISSDLKKEHIALVALARKLDISVDFTPDFLKWLKRDLKATKKKLLEIKAQHEGKNESKNKGAA